MSLGTLYLILARVCFVFSSYGLHMALAYLISDMADYGRLGVIFSLMSLSRILLTTGVPQIISRGIAANENDSTQLYRNGFTLQIVLGVVIFAVYMIGSPLWSRMLGDINLTRLIYVSGLIIPFTAVLQIMLAWLNGNHRFGMQSSMLVLYSISRIVLALGFVLLGLGVSGVLWGLVTATVICMGTVRCFVPLPTKGSVAEAWGILSSSLPYVFSSVGVIVILSFDLLILKHFYPNSPIVGYYSGAVNIGKLPFFVLIAFSTTLLPVISKAVGMNDMAGARRYACRELSVLLIILVLSSTLIMATATEVLDFVYPSSFTAVADALRILFWASSGLALMQALLSVFGAIGRINKGAVIVWSCVPLQIVLGWLLTPRYGAQGVALANLLTVFTGIGVLSFVLWRIFGTFLFGSTFLFCIPAAGLTFVVLTRVFPAIPLWLLPGKLIVGAGIFMAALYAMDHRARESVHRGAMTIRSRLVGS